jgi:hypothetical protein
MIIFRTYVIRALCHVLTWRPRAHIRRSKNAITNFSQTLFTLQSLTKVYRIKIEVYNNVFKYETERRYVFLPSPVITMWLFRCRIRNSYISVLVMFIFGWCEVFIRASVSVMLVHYIIIFRKALLWKWPEALKVIVTSALYNIVPWGLFGSRIGQVPVHIAFFGLDPTPFILLDENVSEIISVFRHLISIATNLE